MDRPGTSRAQVLAAAREIGFDLCGIAEAYPVPDAGRYQSWVDAGMAGAMSYLTDHRAGVRLDPERLLEGVRSVICVGRLYNGPEAYSNQYDSAELGWISRYAWGDDYHAVLRAGLERLEAILQNEPNCRTRICVDTAPLLERSYARAAGLGWIGKNTCLINQGRGSWFFLGELLTTLELEPDAPPPDRCGTCRRCIDVCPTEAIVPDSDGGWRLDARLCVSYFTIELRGPIPEEHRAGIGRHVFGCDLCQDVCPWNRKAPTAEYGARDGLVAPPLEKLAVLTEQEFKQIFRGTPVTRAKYTGFLRNVAVAMGNAGLPQFRPHLERLAHHPNQIVAGHARWALARLK